MTAPTIVGAARRAARVAPLEPDTATAWAWLGWFGAVITTVGLGDIALTMYPFHLGVPEWEFGTIAAAVSGLPLVTIGLAALLGSMLARGRRVGVQVVAGLAMTLGILIIASMVIFALDIPVALRVVTPEVSLGIRKAIAKTVMLGVVFSAGYLFAAVAALRHARRA